MWLSIDKNKYILDWYVTILGVKTQFFMFLSWEGPGGKMCLLEPTKMSQKMCPIFSRKDTHMCIYSINSLYFFMGVTRHLKNIWADEISWFCKILLSVGNFTVVLPKLSRFQALRWCYFSLNNFTTPAPIFFVQFYSPPTFFSLNFFTQICW